MMEQEVNAIEAVSRAVNRIAHKGRFAEITLENGIVLTCRPVPPHLMNAVMQEFKPPPPPKVMIEEKGREEENPNDPEYIRLVSELIEEQELAITNLLLGVGTVVKSVPDGYFRPEEDGWITTVEYASKLANRELRIEKDDPLKRYICWLRFYAIETGNDVVLCRTLPMQLAGIREEEIDEVLDYFRSVQERRTDTEPPVETASSNGHTTNRATRRASSRN